MSYDSPVAAFRAAVELAGGQTAFAREVGCTQGNIWQLLNKGSCLPGQYVLKAEAATGVSRHDLRPDLYPREAAPSFPAVLVSPGAATVRCDRRAVSHQAAR